MKWFKHDTNAHTDAKLDKVLMHYGVMVTPFIGIALS